MKNINITKANNLKFKGISGHCKSVYIIDKDKVCISLIEAAKVIGCAPSTLSYALANETRCKGYQVCWLSDVPKHFHNRLTKEVALKEATNIYEAHKANCDALYEQYIEAKRLMTQAEKKMKALMQ